MANGAAPALAQRLLASRAEFLESAIDACDRIERLAAGRIERQPLSDRDRENLRAAVENARESRAKFRARLDSLIRCRRSA